MQACCIKAQNIPSSDIHSVCLKCPPSAAMQAHSLLSALSISGQQPPSRWRVERCCHSGATQQSTPT